jgi:hypothetical protein
MLSLDHDATCARSISNEIATSAFVSVSTLLQLRTHPQTTPMHFKNFPLH